MTFAISILNVVYLLIPTSNHNRFHATVYQITVVYLLIPTSNHNRSRYCHHSAPLFISWFLHQTTTTPCPSSIRLCCLSLDSYIKPQRWINRHGFTCCCLSLDSYIKPQRLPSWPSSPTVVYLLIPTSNHNLRHRLRWLLVLFISWFLHQTTTQARHPSRKSCCLSLDSYIKPQPFA